MPVTNQNFSIFAGNHNRILFTVEDAETLNGATIEWKLSNHESTPFIIKKSSTDSTEIEVEGKTFTIRLYPEETLELIPDTSHFQRKKFYHEAKIFDFTDEEFTVSTGYMTLFNTLYGKEVDDE